jgi:hypothetical protein
LRPDGVDPLLMPEERLNQSTAIVAESAKNSGRTNSPLKSKAKNFDGLRSDLDRQQKSFAYINQRVTIIQNDRVGVRGSAVEPNRIEQRIKDDVGPGDSRQ